MTHLELLKFSRALRGANHEDLQKALAECSIAKLEYLILEINTAIYFKNNPESLTARTE